MRHTFLSQSFPCGRALEVHSSLSLRGGARPGFVLSALGGAVPILSLSALGGAVPISSLPALGGAGPGQDPRSIRSVLESPEEVTPHALVTYLRSLVRAPRALAC